MLLFRKYVPRVVARAHAAMPLTPAADEHALAII